MVHRLSLLAAGLSLTLSACDSAQVTPLEPVPTPVPVVAPAPVVEPGVEVSFRTFAGYYVRQPYVRGTYVFRTSAEWATVYDPRNRPALDFADSLVVAISYGEVNACVRGGAFESITRRGGQATATLAPVLVPSPQCMAEYPYHRFARVAKADLPTDVAVTFVVPAAQQMPPRQTP